MYKFIYFYSWQNYSENMFYNNSNHIYKIECAKFMGLVPSCFRGSEIFSLEYFVGPKFLSGGYFAGPKFFLVGPIFFFFLVNI